VTVVGPPDIVRALKPEQIVPRADLTQVKQWGPEKASSGTASVPIEVQLNQVEVQVQPPVASIKW
jgi:hypothetical protein